MLLHLVPFPTLSCPPADALAGSSDNAQFLTGSWFGPQNASNLRDHLRFLILRCMVDKAEKDGQDLGAAHQELASDSDEGDGVKGQRRPRRHTLLEVSPLAAAIREIQLYEKQSNRWDDNDQYHGAGFCGQCVLLPNRVEHFNLRIAY